MHYPWWYVSNVTGPMLIALVATVHVFVSMYAVGGGIYLAGETGYAYKVNNKSLLEYLRSHALFFILLTVVFGAITGVGIWWTIGLTSPSGDGVSDSHFRIRMGNGVCFLRTRNHLPPLSSSITGEDSSRKFTRPSDGFTPRPPGSAWFL